MSTLWRFDDRRGSIARETDISAECAPTEENPWVPRADEDQGRAEGVETPAGQGAQTADRLTGRFPRSEEHTSELQSLAYLVCRLLLEKKKKRKKDIVEN